MGKNKRIIINWKKKVEKKKKNWNKNWEKNWKKGKRKVQIKKGNKSPIKKGI